MDSDTHLLGRSAERLSPATEAEANALVAELEAANPPRRFALPAATWEAWVYPDGSVSVGEIASYETGKEMFGEKSVHIPAKAARALAAVIASLADPGIEVPIDAVLLKYGQAIRRGEAVGYVSMINNDLGVVEIRWPDGRCDHVFAGELSRRIRRGELSIVPDDTAATTTATTGANEHG